MTLYMGIPLLKRKSQTQHRAMVLVLPSVLLKVHRLEWSSKLQCIVIPPNSTMGNFINHGVPSRVFND